MFDTLLTGGRVVDGTGSPWFRADVGISDGRIVYVGRPDGSTARRMIDVGDLVVAPGFVDIHSHADFILPLRDHMEILEPLVAQGITSVVAGNCGLSPCPVDETRLDQLQTYTAFFEGGELSWDWRSLGDFLTRLEQEGVGLNTLQLASHGAIRIAVMGFEAREASARELTAMRLLAADAMEQGAFGLSAGLIYAPGMYASTDELLAVTEALVPYRGVFTCHVRGSSETGLESTEEIIHIARRNGIPVQHSHIEGFGEPYWGNIDETIRLHDSARAEGVDITFDVIPYTMVNTTLTACLPPYAFEGGIERLIDRLRDPEARARVGLDIESMVSEWPTWRPGTWPHNFVRATGWDNIKLLWAQGEQSGRQIGRSMAEIGAAMCKSPFDAMADLLIEENGVALALYAGSSGDFEHEEGLRQFLAHPHGSINTDAILTGRGIPHPAAYGAFPRVLSRYVREQGLLRLEEAVRKMTSLSLRRFNVQDRGLVREGMWADITVFDPESVKDNSTPFDSARRPSGIEYVLVNGQVIVEKGSVDREARAGRVLRRG